jgi:hypothetical protein
MRRCSCSVRSGSLPPYSQVQRSRLLGLAALALLAVATAPLMLVVAIAAWTAVLVAMAVVDTIRALAIGCPGS